MTDLDVAHLRIQGVDVVIAFLDSAFDHKSQNEQNQASAAIQSCSRSAGLAGNVVLVWQDAFGPDSRGGAGPLRLRVRSRACFVSGL